MKAAYLILLSLVVNMGSTSAFAQDALPMQAHPFHSKGPWFEGWYTRVTDEQNQISFAVITTSAIHEGEDLLPVDNPGGYVAVIIRDHEDMISREDFPARTSIINIGADFQWRSAQASVSAHETVISVGDAQVALKIESRIPWGGAGPEGWLSNLPLPLHWYVYNMGGLASYRLRYRAADGTLREVKGRGRVHQEKNWGEVFPRSWIWLQAFDHEAALSIAGGDLEINGVVTHTYLVGYRTKNVSIDFNLGQGLLTSFTDRIQACARSFEMTADNGEYRLVLKATGSDFAELSIPTNTGYERNGAIESFKSRIQLQLFRASGFVLAPSYSLIETRTIKDAALELGAAAMNCPTR